MRQHTVTERPARASGRLASSRRLLRGRRVGVLDGDPGALSPAWAAVRAAMSAQAALEGQGLTRDGIPSPSQHDRARNRHRTGEGWSKSAVRVILANPR